MSCMKRTVRKEAEVQITDSEHLISSMCVMKVLLLPCSGKCLWAFISVIKWARCVCVCVVVVGFFLVVFWCSRFCTWTLIGSRPDDTFFVVCWSRDSVEWFCCHHFNICCLGVMKIEDFVVQITLDLFQNCDVHEEASVTFDPEIDALGRSRY